jgi:hypothetical protein
MNIYTLKDFVKGWFIGNFVPTLISTNEVEVAVKRYKAGDYEAAHYHKIATELTVIVSGEVEMNGYRFGPDCVIVIAPGEETDFKCLTDVVTTVVKYPGASNDKYVVGEK